MGIEQVITKRKKIIMPLFFLILIFLSLIFVKFLLNRMNSYITENGKSSMGAVVEQIQQTYDLQVNGYYSQLHLLEDSLIQEEVRSIELDRNKKFFEAWQKESESTLATVYKGNIIKNLIMDCQSYTKYRPKETTGGILVSWRRKEELPTGA